jgi:hypothetical protein
MAKHTKAQLQEFRADVAERVAVQAGRLTHGHAPAAVVLSILQTLRGAADAKMLTGDDVQAAFVATLDRLGLEECTGPTGWPEFRPKA